MFYHGTNQKIKSFVDNFVGQGIDKEGPGIYFTSSFDDAARYGDYIYVVKLHLDQAVSTEEGAVDRNELETLIRKSPDLKSHLMDWDENPEIALKMAIDNFLDYNETPHEIFQSVWYDFFRYNPVEYVRGMVELGYDGVFVNKREGVVHAIVFNPKKIEFVELEKLNNEKEQIKEMIRKEVKKIINN